MKELVWMIYHCIWWRSLRAASRRDRRTASRPAKDRGRRRGDRNRSPRRWLEGCRLSPNPSAVLAPHLSASRWPMARRTRILPLRSNWQWRSHLIPSNRSQNTNSASATSTIHHQFSFFFFFKFILI